MAAYATRRDVYRYGLARGTLGAQSRLVESSLASTDTITLDGHGFETDDQVILRAIEGGTLSAPLVAGTTYYVIRINDSTFKLSATEGGAAIDLTSNGVSMSVAAALPIDDVLEFYSRWVDGVVPHLAPLESPYPILVVGVVAQLAAKLLQNLAGHASNSMNEIEAGAKEQLKLWAAGVPVRDSRVTGSSNKAVLVAMPETDARGWPTGGLP